MARSGGALSPSSRSVQVGAYSRKLGRGLICINFLSARSGQRMAIWGHIRRISAVASLVVFLAAWLGCPAGFAVESKRVLLLHSFGQTFKPWSEYGQAIRAELDRQSPWPLDIIDYSVVSARFSDENPEVPFVEYLRALFARHPLDVIVSIGAPAAAFVQRNRQRLFATTPMVLMAVDQRRVQYSNLTANDVAVAVRINYLSAFENILQGIAGDQQCDRGCWDFSA